MRLYERWHDVAPTPAQIAAFLRAFDKAGVVNDKMDKLFAHVAIIASQAGADSESAWTSRDALVVARAMVVSKSFSQHALQALLCVASRDPSIMDDPSALRSIKIVEVGSQILIFNFFEKR